MACLIAGGAVGLRLLNLDRRSIWFDEASSWLTAVLPANELWSSLQQSTHVPLYYPILRCWMSVFGESPTALRGLSVVCGLLTVGGCGWLGHLVWRSVGTEQWQAGSALPARSSRSLQREGEESGYRRKSSLGFGLLCAGLCAVSAFQVRASVEARMYSLGTLLCVVSTGLTTLLLQQPKRRRLWVGLGVITIASLYTHHLLAVTAAVQALFLMARCFSRGSRDVSGDSGGVTTGNLELPRDRRSEAGASERGERGEKTTEGLDEFRYESSARVRRSLCVVTIACVCAAWTPALVLWWKQVTRVSRGFWIPPMDRWSVPRVCLEFIASPPTGLWWQYRHWGIPIAGFFLWVVIRVWMKGGLTRRLLVCQAVIPMLVLAFVSLKTPLWEGRYFRFAHVSLLLCVAIFLFELRSSRLRVVLSGLTLGVFLAGCLAFWSLREIPERQAVRGAMSWLQEHDPESQRPLIVTSPMNYVIAKYYAPMFGRSRDKVWLYTGEVRNPHAAVHLISQSDWWPEEELPENAWLLHKDHEQPPSAREAVELFRSDTWIDEWTVRVSWFSGTLNGMQMPLEDGKRK